MIAVDGLGRLLGILARLLEMLVVAIVAALVADVLWGVVSRFLLGAPSRWTEELAVFLLIWLSLLGAAVGFRRQQHLGVDYLVKKLDPGSAQVLHIVSLVVVTLFAGSVMVFGGSVLVTETLAAGQRTPALGWMMGHVYLAVPLSGVCIVLFCLEQIGGEFRTPATEPPTRTDEIT